MKNIEILKNKLIQLESEVNINPLHNIEFHNNQVKKENMSFTGGNGRIWIQPFHREYDISLSGKSIEKHMYRFMCDLCGKNHNGYKQTKPEPHAPFWRITDFKLVEKAVYHYAKIK
jgi:hypothetical protein